MHIYFSGIGGAGIGPLALIAKQAGYEVSGSDKQDSQYIDYLKKHGVTNIHIGQTTEAIDTIHKNQPIDWFVYSSALPKENPEHPELVYCQTNQIKTSKRDELLNEILSQKNLRLLAIAGTHGKTTTTAMVVWLLKSLGLPLSYSVGAKTSFSDTGHFEHDSQYFVYECDEYDRNFLAFHPYMSIITGIAYDHPDVYPTEEQYRQAFRDFIGQSSHKVTWLQDMQRLNLQADNSYILLNEDDEAMDKIKLAGLVNRQNGWQVVNAITQLTDRPMPELIEYMNKFPGVARRFEKISDNIYSDYAHTPEKVRGAIQMAHEVAGNKVVVVYEGLHNTRQHFIKDQLKNLFDDVKRLYIVPSYLAREDESLELLTPTKLLDLLSNNTRGHAEAAQLDQNLKNSIKNHTANGDLVLCLSAGGGDSLDEWLRENF